MSAKLVTSYGSYAETIGNVGGSATPQIIVEIAAKSNPEIVTRICASYADADIDKPNVQGRVIVLSEVLASPDDFIDPADDNSPGISSPVHDFFVSEKHNTDFLRPGETMPIPPHQTWQFILTSAYSDGDVGGAPSDKQAKFAVKGYSQSGGKRLENY